MVEVCLLLPPHRRTDCDRDIILHAFFCLRAHGLALSAEEPTVACLRFVCSPWVAWRASSLASTRSTLARPSRLSRAMRVNTRRSHFLHLATKCGT